MSKKHLYWGYQSTQSSEPTEAELKTFQSKYKKDFNQRELYEGEELEDEFRLRSWRNPLFSEIISIILAFEHENTLRVQYVTGTEADLLQNFVNTVKNNFQDYKIVHFDSEITLPFIGVRLNKNEHLVPPHNDLKYLGSKSWDLTGLDIKSYYRGAGRYSYSLEEIAKILNLESDGIIPYEDEFTYYKSESHAELKSSAIKKVEVLSRIHRKLFGLNELETVLVEDSVKDVEEVAPKNWANELYRTKDFNCGIKEYLKSLKILKKDKQVLENLVLAHYLEKIDVMSKNKKELEGINKNRTEEVTEFFKTL